MASKKASKVERGSSPSGRAHTANSSSSSPSLTFRTRRLRHRGQLTFVIDDITNRIREAEEEGRFASIFSPPFMIHGGGEESWKFRVEVILNTGGVLNDVYDRDRLPGAAMIDPNNNDDGEDEEDHDDASSRVSRDLEVVLHSEDQQRPRATVEFCLVNPETEEVLLREEIVSCLFATGWGFSDFVNKERLLHSSAEKLIFGGSLTLVVKVSVITETVETTSESPGAENTDKFLKFSASNERGKLISDLEIACRGQKWTDLTLESRNDPDSVGLPVNRFVLAARSPVFSAMFSHDSFRENSSRVVRISDFSASNIRHFWRFCYSDSLPEEVSQKELESLLKMADKYDVPQLRSLAGERLISDFLNVDSAAKILEIADETNSVKLGKFVANFIKTNRAGVLKSEHFSLLTRDLVQKVS